MAEHLAAIFGTEKDKVNCSFYFKIGACRHGDKCSRIHNKPTFSQTILLQNLYQNPKRDARGPNAAPGGVSDAEEQQHFDEFFEEIFTELEDKYGEIEEMNVCDNIGEHMIGNVYVKFKCEEDAEKAVQALNNRWFGGAPIYAELSPVTDFREACCRQYEMGECTRGGFCNFMHLKPISYELRRELYNRDHPWRKPSEKSKKNQRRNEKGKTRGCRRSRKRNGHQLWDQVDENDQFAWEMIEAVSSRTMGDSAGDGSDSKGELPAVFSFPRRRSRSSSVPKSYHLPTLHSDSQSSNSSSFSPSINCPLYRPQSSNGSASLSGICECTAQDRSSGCNKGDFCNFMHLKPISREIRRRLYGRKKRPSPYGGRRGKRQDEYDDRRRSRSRERDRRNRY